MWCERWLLKADTAAPWSMSSRWRHNTPITCTLYLVLHFTTTFWQPWTAARSYTRLKMKVNRDHPYLWSRLRDKFSWPRSHQTFPSKPVKNSLPNSPLLSLNRSFLFNFSIFFMSAGLNLKSPSKLALILAGVLDFGNTEWPCVTPQAVEPTLNTKRIL